MRKLPPKAKPILLHFTQRSNKHQQIPKETNEEQNESGHREFQLYYLLLAFPLPCKLKHQSIRCTMTLLCLLLELLSIRELNKRLEKRMAMEDVMR